jgi:uncharacterized protein YodC (DUF2158 family)
MSEEMKRAEFSAADLRPVRAARQHRRPSIGEMVRLNSGGPVGLVVDVERDEIVVVWPAKSQGREYTMHQDCVQVVQ